MQGQNQQQAYDRGITIFSPDGRLYQVEYAREAVKRGTASVGVRTADGVVLVADRSARSPLMEEDSIEKLHTVDDHVGVASAGHVADARKLVDIARRYAQRNQLRYDEPVGVESLTKEVTDAIQEYTQTGGARPFGVALLFAGIEDGEPRLFETDPSGTPSEWQATAIGNGREQIMTHLEDEYSEDLTLGDGIALALSALAAASEDALDAVNVDVATADAESGVFRKLDREEIQDYVEDLDVDAEETDE